MNMIATSTNQAAYALFSQATSGIQSQAYDFIAGAKRGPMQARAFIGLSKNSKMPAYTIAIPARESCPRGGKLAKVAGTVCFDCYAVKGHDAMTPAIKAKERRWSTIKLALTSGTVRALWLEAFVVSMKSETYFRWHSAGDIFSPEYAQLMLAAIKLTPHVKHWIPTKEPRLSKVLLGLSNCTVRLSDDMVNQAKNKYQGLTSGVHTAENGGRGQACVAPNQEGQCLDCRACWSADVAHVSYKIH